MYDIELDRKKCQREVWVRQREYINLKIKAGLRVRDILTDIPTEELRTLLEYAIKGIEQELQTLPTPKQSPVRDALSSQTEAACAVRVPVIEILDTVLEQAEDDGLWFNAKHASEAYLQQELRRLHAVIERAYAELSKTKEPSSAPPQQGV